MRHPHSNRFSPAPLALAVALALSAPALTHAQAAADAKPVVISIASQPLGDALNELGAAIGASSVAFSQALVAGKTAPSVSGTLTVRQALNRLLAGSGLVGTIHNGILTVQRAPEISSEAALPEVKVTARAERAGDLAEVYVGGQVARGGRVGVLGNKDVMDTPFNITHYTAQKVQDQGAQFLRDVLIDDSSFRSGEGDYFGNSAKVYNFRGFSSNPANSVTFNGLYNILGNVSAMPEFAERIEVLKGPSAMLRKLCKTSAAPPDVRH